MIQPMVIAGGHTPGDSLGVNELLQDVLLPDARLTPVADDLAKNLTQLVTGPAAGVYVDLSTSEDIPILTPTDGNQCA